MNRIFKRNQRIYLNRIKEHRVASDQLSEVTLRIVADDNVPCLTEDVYFALVAKQCALTALVQCLSDEIDLYKKIVEEQNE